MRLLNYEDNLFNEIERILIEIINNHVNYDLKKNEIDIIKFERHVKNFLI
jgi:anti-sigma regulatory factor (Ser/Thr protein kinase)